MSNEQKWVYKSNWDFTLGVKPSQRKVVADAYGNNMMHTEKPVRVRFTNGFLVVNEALAKNVGLPIDTLVNWIEMTNDFGRRFWLIQSPTKVATVDEVKKIEEAVKARPKMPKVKHGSRTTGK